MNVHREETTCSPGEDIAGRAVTQMHLRPRKPHRARSALRTLRAELESLYNELTAALLPDAKGKK
jgi:hypothetical protein